MIGDDEMMISGDMSHAEAKDNSITQLKERSYHWLDAWSDQRRARDR